MHVRLLTVGVARRVPFAVRSCCFFFKAEDGIRDYKVTGVQTCALPISSGPNEPAAVPVAPPALLALADGTVFRGASAGAAGLASGEVVFNTAITGYQEILTDPDRKSTRLNSSHLVISYAVFCLKKKT